MSGAESIPKTEGHRQAAISFLARDVTLAGELATKLEENLDVFYFPHAQEELAGTDGMESMREPFLSALVAIVLYRQPWGETPWTRVEETAIKERCLQRGWGSLMFVQLDRTSAMPKWLPETHIRYVLEDYGLDGLVGAIKARIQEQGGELHKPDALGHRYRQVKDVEDDPAVPRETFFSRISRLEADYLPAPALAAVGALVMIGVGSLVPVLVAAGAGGLLGAALGRMIQQKHATRVQEQLARGGLLLWVNVRTPHEEETALEVLRTNGAHDVHAHDIVA